MYKLRNIIVGLVLVVVIILPGCAKQYSSPKSKKAEPIKIGFVGPLSGDAASIGLNIRAAVELAEKEANDKGGINGRKIEVIFEDGKCDSKAANAAGNRLINANKVKYIVGGICSGETLAITPMAEKNKVVLLSPASTNPDITKAGDYVFRLIPSDLFQGKFAAEYVYNTMGKKKVAILYTKNNWGSGVSKVFAAKFKELGGEVVVTESVEISDRDVKAQLTKIKNSSAQVVYMPTQVENGIAAIKQIRELGINLPVLGGDLWDGKQIPQKSGKAAEGVMFTVAATKKLPDEFINKMNKIKNGDNVNVYAPRAYDAINILADVIGKLGVETSNVKTGLYKLNNYNGVGETYTMDLNGDVTAGDFVVNKFVSGKIVEVK